MSEEGIQGAAAGDRGVGDEAKMVGEEAEDGDGRFIAGVGPEVVILV